MSPLPLDEAVVPAVAVVEVVRRRR